MVITSRNIDRTQPLSVCFGIVFKDVVPNEPRVVSEFARFFHAIIEPHHVNNGIRLWEPFKESEVQGCGGKSH